MKTNPSTPEKFVRDQHRVRQGMPPSAAVACGLAATLCLIWLWHRSIAPVEDWSRLRPCWIAGIGLTLLSAVVIWRWRRRSLLRSAAELDMVLEASNRLETATTLREANDPLARAQREETERFLERTPVASRRRLLSVLRVEVLLLMMAHAATLVCWTRPWDTVNREPDAAAAAEEAEKAETATLDWKSPESETTATEIEEVPLEAEANSTSGLRDVALEAEVNGEKRLTQPLAGDEWKRPGKHPIKASLYLDQLEVKTFDVVSYHLRAQRIGRSKLPPTISPVQFVQVKPMREDTFICAGGDKPDRCFNYVTALKAAQLRLMKENFALAHAEISRDHPEWRETNDRVGGEQGELAGRTVEVVELMTTNHYPPEILTLVRQSQPLMEVAADKIKERQNEPALPPQGKALGYLTEVEKYLENQITLAGRNERPKARDPFQRPKNLEIKNHPLTLAGKVDQLAAQQSKLAGELSLTDAASNATAPAEDRKDTKPGSGSFAQRQSEIQNGIGDLLEEGMEPKALEHLEAGHDQAGISQENLERNDVPAAREPAATAARELRQTAVVLRQANGQMAKNELADALYKLAQAASNARRASQMNSDAEARAQLEKAEAEVRQAAQQLAAAGRAQAEQGFPDSGERLNDLSKRLRDESLEKLMRESHAQPRDAALAEALASRLDRLADQAAHQRNPGPLSRPELARLVERMQRARANLRRLASSCAKSGPAQSGENSGEAGQSGESGESGESGMSGQSGQQGQSGSQSSAQNQNASQGSKSDGQNQPSHQAGESGMARNGGSGSGSGQSAIMRSESRPEERERQFAAQLLDDLRADALDASSVASGSGDVDKLRNILGRSPGASLGLDRLPGLFEEIDPPLEAVIQLLRVELANGRRPHPLFVAELEEAPAAYRPAVADYFERLSRDYEPAKAASR